MIWQDLVFSTGSFLFVIALLPSIFSKDKPPITTSIMTGSVLIIFAAAYTTLSLWLSASITLLTGILWLTLAGQKYIIKKKVQKK